MISQNQMLKPKKSTVLAGAAIAVTLLTAGAGVINAQTADTSTASAQTTSTKPMWKMDQKGNMMASFVTAIAQKFNLNTADVQAVVDSTMQADHAAMEAKMQQASVARLAQAVTDGTLTQAQADLIEAKAAELKATMEASRTADQALTLAERKAKMDAQQTALKTWAATNNIPETYLHFVGGPGFMGHGPRGGYKQ